jgi:branched-chain amino acid transport system substrate-binding protein
VDAVFFGGLSTPGARLIRQLREAGYNGQFIGGDGIYQTEFINYGGPAAIGAYGSCPCVDAAGGSAEATAFALDYRRIYGSPPGAFSAEYYDTAGLFLRAIDDGVTDRAGVLAWLRDADVVGLTKRIRFESDGNVRGGPIYIYRVSPQKTFVRAATVVDGKVIG